jgi:hypothetical protein
MDGTFWGIFTGTVVGIVAGAFLQYGAQRLFARWQSRSLLAAFKRELEYDIPVIESLIQEAGRLRGSIGAGLASYTGYFKLTDVFFVLSNRALAEGLLYQSLEQEDLLRLQKAATFFSAASENWVASKIQTAKQGQTTPLPFVDFLERQLIDHRDALKKVTQKLH